MNMIRYLSAAALAVAVLGAGPGFAQVVLPSPIEASQVGSRAISAVLPELTRMTADSTGRAVEHVTVAARPAKTAGGGLVAESAAGSSCGPGWSCPACSAGWQYEGSLSRVDGIESNSRRP